MPQNNLSDKEKDCISLYVQTFKEMSFLFLLNTDMGVPVSNQEHPHYCMIKKNQARSQDSQL